MRDVAKDKRDRRKASQQYKVGTSIELQDTSNFTSRAATEYANGRTVSTSTQEEASQLTLHALLHILHH